MHTDPMNTGGDLQQPQASATIQPRLDACPPPLTFFKDMNYEQLAAWLITHPHFMGVDYQHDISKLKGIHIVSLLIV